MSILLDSLDHSFHLQGLHAGTTQLPRIAFLSYKINHKKHLAFEVSVWFVLGYIHSYPWQHTAHGL